MIHLGRRTSFRRAGLTRSPAAPGPTARVADDGLCIDGRLLAGFELAPVNLELLAEVERAATLESLAAVYDAIPRSFQLLSVPAERNPGDHLAAMEERAEGKRILRTFAAYAALYREIAAAPRRPLRRTYLLLDAASEPELRRVVTSLARVAEERGVVAREVGGARARHALGDRGPCGCGVSGECRADQRGAPHDRARARPGAGRPTWNLAG